MSKIVIINSPSQLEQLIKDNTIVVIDFHAVWCGPCKAVAPAYGLLAERLTKPGSMVFAKVDVDKQKPIAQAYNVSAMPTFIMIKSGTETTRIKGADLPALKSAVEELVAASGGSGGPIASGSSSSFWKGAEIPKSYTILNSEIEVKNLDCMNYDREVGGIRVLFEGSEPSTDASGSSSKGKGKSTGDDKGADWVESDTDEQIMLFIPFQSTVKIYQIQITSRPPPVEDEDDTEQPRRPTKLKLFTNKPNIVGFSEADNMVAAQQIEIKEEDWKDGTAAINTKFVKFQNVFSLNLFVEDAEGDAEKVRIDRIRIIGDVGEKRELGKLEKVGEE
ncbi:hypothetical protein TWF481_000326 [Arthrobotrys musiformis]|uniref:Thioredoxin n=1 Tax=Arthrobotrys musiformis TaxID=47236 RepID=A0AAV9WM95_9PEZI